jgi:hypothetical protein
MSPSSCSISKDSDGTYYDLQQAFTNLSLFLGNKQISYTLEVVGRSPANMNWEISGNESVKKFQLTKLPANTTSGYVKFQFTTAYGDEITSVFQFSVVQDVNTLDWIQAWDNNKTKIGSTYLITPELFVGKKIESESGFSSLSGVYIGGGGTDTGGIDAGIYGYYEGTEIFRINKNGGKIGGWKINQNGITSPDEGLRILSSGSIFSIDPATQNEFFWIIDSKGAASFAKGNVVFNANGNATFKGSVTSSSGIIGGWKVTEKLLHSDHIFLDSSSHYIGISPWDIPDEVIVDDEFDHYDVVKISGGVAIRYASDTQYGIEGFLPENKQTFALGSTNRIAGWNFDEDSLWIGTKKNEAGYTTNTNSITIGTAGLRGNSWYIDTNGNASFMSGKVEFSGNSGKLLGWNMTDWRLYTNYVLLVSEPNLAGLYLSDADIHDVPSSSLKGKILSAGGIFMRKGEDSAELTGAWNGHAVFSLTSNGASFIAGWSFDSQAIYCGTPASSGFTGNSGSITIGAGGIRGYKWRLEPDGSGALAGGNITWDSDGSGTLAGGNITWDSNGVFSFGQAIGNSTTINNGLILSSSIFVCDQGGVIKAGMSAEGSGETGIRFFAGAANPILALFRVDETGFLYSTKAHIEGEINAISGKIGGFEIATKRIGVAASASGGGNSYPSDDTTLCIKEQFFQVGGKDAYVQFGNNIIDSFVGGSITAAGWVKNKAYNPKGDDFVSHINYGLGINVSGGQKNYGLSVDVTGENENRGISISTLGGTKNYGVFSNAPLIAPGFVSTKIKRVNLNGASYSIDFSLASIFLLSSNSNVTVFMPNEQYVCNSFGYDSLPSDFGILITFKVAGSSSTITLDSLYDTNGNNRPWDIAGYDSITFLAYNENGLKYAVLNYNT